jgi:hypothetical protein
MKLLWLCRSMNLSYVLRPSPLRGVMLGGCLVSLSLHWTTHFRHWIQELMERGMWWWYFDHTLPPLLGLQEFGSLLPLLVLRF